MKTVQITLISNKKQCVVATCDDINIDYVSTELLFSKEKIGKVYDLLQKLKNGSFTLFSDDNIVSVTLLKETWQVTETNERPKMRKDVLIQQISNILDKKSKVKFGVLIQNNLFVDIKIEIYQSPNFILCKGMFIHYERKFYVKTMDELIEKIYSIIIEEIQNIYQTIPIIEEIVYLPLTKFI